MLKKITLAASFSVLALGLATASFAADKKTKPSKQQVIVALLSQPTAKLKKCARMGLLGYQNALSGNYLVGRKDLPKDLVRSYAWADLAYERIKKTDNKKLLKIQKKAVDFIASKMSKGQISEGKELAQSVMKHYSSEWSAVPDLKHKYPAECAISFDKE